MKAPYLDRVALRGCPTKPTPLTLGTWGAMTTAYQGLLTDEAFQELVVEAYKLGIRSFDLALLWEGERAMRLLSEALGDDMASCFFFLRAGRLPTDRPNAPISANFALHAVRPHLERARELLGGARIDVLLLHAPPRTLVERTETLESLEELRREDMVGAIGISTTSGAVGLAALEKGFACAAMPYNALQTHAVRELDEGFPAVGDDNPRCVLAHSPLLHGVLPASIQAGHVYPQGDHRSQRWSEDALLTRLRHAEAMRDLTQRHTNKERQCETYIPNLTALALRFALSHPRVASVAIGPRSIQQLTELIDGIKEADPLALDAYTLREIETRLAIAGA